jgi:predicted metal-binding membrane protein
MSSQALELVLRRDRAVIVAALVVITGLAWAYVLWLANDMAMDGMDMPDFRMIPSGMGLMMPVSAPWQPIEFVFTFVMWVVMMIGMMTPSAANMVLLYARVGRQAEMQGKPFASSNWFFGGYLLAWVAFALVATLAQWAAQRASLLTPMMGNASVIFDGALLMTAGLYQWTPLKDACLRQCQAPLQFLQRHGGFRRDAKGSLELGLRHGAYCVGCCWTLMTLLFVGVLMNPLWIAALTIFVLVEKVIPAGRVIARVAGGVLVAGGGWLLATALIQWVS